MKWCRDKCLRQGTLDKKVKVVSISGHDFKCNLGGVYMGKLALAQVSYRTAIFISYRVYMMTGSFHILLFQGTLHVDKIHVWFKITNITHAIPIRNKWSFRVYMITLRDFLPWYNNRGELTLGDLHRHHDVLWWYRVNKFRAMRGNRSELAPAWKAPLVSWRHPLKLGSCSWLMQAVALLEIAYWGHVAV